MFFSGFVIVQHLWLELSALLMFLFVLNRSSLFRQALANDHSSILGKAVLSVTFGLIGMFGTYWGIPVVLGEANIHAFGNAFLSDWATANMDGIANTRAVGVIVGGLVGGPWVGTFAGLMAGIHRYYAFSTFSSVLSAGITVGQGMAAGYLYKTISGKRNKWHYGLLIGFLLEVGHMVVLFIFGEPFERAQRLVYAITPAMLITNSIGVAAFIGLMEAGRKEKETTEAFAAKAALTIANKTTTFLKRGLDESSACEAARIVFSTVGTLGAVAITSREKGLALVSKDNCCKIGFPVTRSATQVMESGRCGIYQKKHDIDCPELVKGMAAHIVVPLTLEKKAIGSLALYKLHENSISLYEKEFACGLAELISTQLEISKAERQAKLLANAEVKSLQSQINPHFLFNALNTISYYCRKQPDIAKQLIIHLGNYYRNNLAENEAYVELRKEIQNVDDYVRLEIARYKDRLQVYYQLDEEAGILLPPLILQPLVENAIKHGITPKAAGGAVWISSHNDGDSIRLVVKDDGVGIKPELLQKILEPDPNRKSIGLCNVNKRLISIYGPDNGLHIHSAENGGTEVTMTIPRIPGLARA
jgi:two-component system sensor histidine kinase LytS